MPLSVLEYLRHVLAETAYLLNSSCALEKAAFLQDETLKRAYVRSIEVIGEAIKQIPDATRQKYPAIEWLAIARMRDRLIHGYFGVDYDIVWDVVTNKIPALDLAVKEIITQEYPEHEQ
jgi:uncharacterized protein with HEPN domain